jgi:hypothetical protein
VCWYGIPVSKKITRVTAYPPLEIDTGQSVADVAIPLGTQRCTEVRLPRAVPVIGDASCSVVTPDEASEFSS